MVARNGDAPAAAASGGDSAGAAAGAAGRAAAAASTAVAGMVGAIAAAAMVAGVAAADAGTGVAGTSEPEVAYLYLSGGGDVERFCVERQAMVTTARAISIGVSIYIFRN